MKIILSNFIISMSQKLKANGQKLIIIPLECLC